MNIIKHSVGMYFNPEDSLPLETECLFGETIQILDEYSDWVHCKLLTDNYIGWIKRKNLGKFYEPTHRVIAERTFIYKENSKSNCLDYLPMGSNLLITKIHSNWAEIFYLNQFEFMCLIIM